MYNPQLETFLCVAEAGQLQQGGGEAVHLPDGGHQADQPAGGESGRPALRAHAPGACADKGGAIAGSGRAVHHPVLQGFGERRAKNAMEETQSVYPHRRVAHDARASAGRPLAEPAGAVLQCEIPDRALREYVGKRPRDPRQSRTDDRRGRRDFRRDDAAAAQMRGAGDFARADLLRSVDPSQARRRRTG